MKTLGGLVAYLLGIYAMHRLVLELLLLPLRGSLRLARICECSAIGPCWGNPSKLWHRVSPRKLDSLDSNT